MPNDAFFLLLFEITKVHNHHDDKLVFVVFVVVGGVGEFASSCAQNTEAHTTPICVRDL